MGSIFYVRHGQASAFTNNYDQLSDVGYNQAEAIGHYFHCKKIQFQSIYVGPLVRHHQTLDGIRKSVNDISSESILELEGLREHQGYKILKANLAKLKEHDPVINALADLPYADRPERVSNHVKLYEAFARHWIEGRYNDLIPDTFQSWDDFSSKASGVFHAIIDQVRPDENILVITSGGPKSIACAQVLGLSKQKTIELSSTLYNGSITVFDRKTDKTTLSAMNQVTHFHDQELLTIV